MIARLFVFVVLLVLTALTVAVIVLAPPVSPPVTVPLASREPETPEPSVAGLTSCLPGDQDKYVYSPDRLVVHKPCVRITGVVKDIQRAEDGDFHIDVQVDPASSSILNAGNMGEGGGFLIVEPVCVHNASPIAEGLCAADPDPLDMSKLAAGQHVWMEGRYVTDSEHHDWSELHPLYAWSVLP